MARTVDEEIVSLKRIARKLNNRIGALEKEQERSKRISEGETGISEGFISRLTKVEAHIKNWESFLRMFDVAQKIYDVGKWLIPLLIGSMMFAHWNMNKTSEKANEKVERAIHQP